MCNKFKELAQAGLGTHPALVLLRAAIPADVPFTIQTAPMGTQAQRTLDWLMLNAVENIVGLGALQPKSQKWACLVLKDGGLGMTSMSIAAPCAHTASWGEALVRIASQIGVHAFPQIAARAPAMAGMREAAVVSCQA